ncbi:MAG: hypothetical protein KDA75_00470 [Planctomycetaceae bacterium]|nr:hypothetical protein [Planctomycetaceae bacterium]
MHQIPRSALRIDATLTEFRKVSRHRVRGGSVIACIAIWIICGGHAPSADAPVFKLSTVRAARSDLDTSLTGAFKQFDDSFRAAQQKYLAAVDVAVKQATRDGDLAEANKLSIEQKLVADSPIGGGVPSLVGAWNVRWSAKGFTPYTFSDNGDVLRQLKDAPTAGVLRRRGDDLIIDFGDQSIMRVNLTRPRLILEYWEKQTDFPHRYPNQIGVGERIR